MGVTFGWPRFVMRRGWSIEEKREIVAESLVAGVNAGEKMHRRAGVKMHQG